MRERAVSNGWEGLSRLLHLFGCLSMDVVALGPAAVTGMVLLATVRTNERRLDRVRAIGDFVADPIALRAYSATPSGRLDVHVNEHVFLLMKLNPCHQVSHGRRVLGL